MVKTGTCSSFLQTRASSVSALNHGIVACVNFKFQLIALPFISTSIKLYPAVGMHSKDESVRLLDQGVWRAFESQQVKEDSPDDQPEVNKCSVASK